jgi:hypothetical protein
MVSIKGGAAVLAAAFLVLASHAAQAATVEAKVPFPFVVNGKTMPAGRYLVEYEGGTGVVQILGEGSNYASMFAMAVPASGHDPAGEQPSLTFKKGETLYRLTSIWQSGDTGRTITGN